MLKSPVMRKSSGTVADEDRNEENSEMNVENGFEYDDESGGRYMLKIVSFEPRDLTVIPKDSKEVNDGRWINSGHNKSLTKKPRPPPMLVFAGWELWLSLG